MYREVEFIQKDRINILDEHIHEYITDPRNKEWLEFEPSIELQKFLGAGYSYRIKENFFYLHIPFCIRLDFSNNKWFLTSNYSNIPQDVKDLYIEFFETKIISNKINND